VRLLNVKRCQERMWVGVFESPSPGPCPSLTTTTTAILITGTHMRTRTRTHRSPHLQGRIVLGAAVEESVHSPVELSKAAGLYRSERFIITYRPDNKKVRSACVAMGSSWWR